MPYTQAYIKFAADIIKRSGKLVRIFLCLFGYLSNPISFSIFCRWVLMLGLVDYTPLMEHPVCGFFSVSSKFGRKLCQKRQHFKNLALGHWCPHPQLFCLLND